MRRLFACVALLLMLNGCTAAVLSGITLGVTLLHDVVQVSSDLLAATSIACQLFSKAQVLHPRTAALSLAWYSPICTNISPNNHAITAATPAWIAAGAAKIAPEIRP